MSYNINLSKEVFDSIPTAKARREATVNYEERRREELFSMVNFINYQMEKASRRGEFSCEVLMDRNAHTAWDLIDLKGYLKSILADLGYKVEFPRCNIHLMIISW